MADKTKIKKYIIIARGYLKALQGRDRKVRLSR
jgi:hypothetical protein